ncbi:MAG: pentapeptide repeat-containing protein [Candidatus Aenigmarchaeota archaeon]|nr:pentapeptide repeat-containing protein [Candidatus Aenigmarchaeota archaeon]
MTAAQAMLRRRRMQIQEFTARLRTGQRDFSHITLHAANLTALNLQGAVFRDSDLSFSNFGGADLTNADFSGCLLSRCTFAKALVKNTTFAHADLTFADLSGARMVSANFANANLLWSHLCGTDLMKANLRGATLDWVCLLGTRLSETQRSVLAPHALFEHRHEQRPMPGYHSGYVRQGVRAYGMQPYAARYTARNGY